MTILRENFFERIENRLAPDRAAAAIAILKKVMARQDISQETIRDAARLVERYRRRTRSAIQEYRQWQATAPVSEVLQGLCDQEGAHSIFAIRSATKSRSKDQLSIRMEGLQPDNS